ncbi:MAG: hypothetical protein DWQ42_02180 [Planctomycetota bacterium]|nr:MAG: hypothetical protein DWQ42_02180 [Planctomycetota bacterium]REK49256.1 MAG: hypothetical protein DWQ46_00585 [Planctomycetota bacterium]
MLPLHERTQRYLCRGAFLALCLLPTLAVAGWCASLGLTDRAAAVARRLSKVSGLEVRVASAVESLPGLVELHEVSFRDPASHASLGESPWVRIASRGETITVKVRQLRVAREALAVVWQLLEDGLAPVAGETSDDLRVEIDRIVVAGGESESRPEEIPALRSVVGRLRPSALGREMTLSFTVDADVAAEPIRLQCVRHDKDTGPQWRWRLLTGAAALPTALVEGVVPVARHFGPSCRLRGSLVFVQAREATWGEFSGTLEDIDLEPLAAAASLGHIDGTARLEVERVKFRGATLDEFRGSLFAGPGQVDSSLLRRLDLLLSRRVRSSFRAAGGPVDYEQLAARFELTPDGWRCEGICDDAVDGALIVGRNELLLRHRRERSQRALANSELLALFADEASPLVPLSRQVAWLLQRLPLFSTDEAASEAAEDASARITQRKDAAARER